MTAAGGVPDDDLDRLLHRADLDGLVRMIDDRCATRDWDGLLRVRDRTNCWDNFARAKGGWRLAARPAPPTVGFSNPEMGAENKVSFQPMTFSGDCLLTTNSGFGGINAALILEKGSIQ